MVDPAVSEGWLLVNEFARVRLRLDTSGHDPRLEIEDLATGSTVLLDPVMLAQLVRLSPGMMHRAMDPGADNAVTVDEPGPP